MDNKNTKRKISLSKLVIDKEKLKELSSNYKKNLLPTYCKWNWYISYKIVYFFLLILIGLDILSEYFTSIFISY